MYSISARGIFRLFALRVALSVHKWVAIMASPLRLIVSRELCTIQPRSNYFIYSLSDTLECGHVEDHYLFNGLADLTNPYTDSPVVRAKRHRCKPCASLLAKRKPVQTVPAIAAAKTA